MPRSDGQACPVVPGSPTVVPGLVPAALRRKLWRCGKVAWKQAWRSSRSLSRPRCLSDGLRRLTAVVKRSRCLRCVKHVPPSVSRATGVTGTRRGSRRSRGSGAIFKSRAGNSGGSDRMSTQAIKAQSARLNVAPQSRRARWFRSFGCQRFGGPFDGSQVVPRRFASNKRKHATTPGVAFRVACCGC